jgi:hypothetical protein
MSERPEGDPVQCQCATCSAEREVRAKGTKYPPFKATSVRAKLAEINPPERKQRRKRPEES